MLRTHENTEMFSAVSCQKKLLFLCMTAALAFGFFLLLPQETFAISYYNNPDCEVTGYAARAPGGNVYVENVEGSMYLFLPREADSQNISLTLEDAADETVCFVVNDEETEVLDLSTLKSDDGKYLTQVRVRSSSGNLTDSFDLTILQGNAAGTVYYSSDDKESKGRSYIDASKSNRGTGRVIVYDASGNNLTAAEKNQVVSDIHSRGDTSWYLPKKSYQIKFDKKISLVDGAGKEKKWVFLAQYKDPLRMSDKIVKDIASLASPLYSPKETWYNFYYDGEYRGLYLVSEKNEVKENRINIKDMEDEYEAADSDYGENVNVKSALNSYRNLFRYQDGLTDTDDSDEPGGFLLEMDNYIDENNGFLYQVNSAVKAINVKSPDLGSRKAVKYISEYFQEFCDAVTAVDSARRHTGQNPSTGLFYYDYCDLDSLADSYLLNCIVSNYDSFSKSQYFYKDCGKKMIAGPCWDYDVCFGVNGWLYPNMNCDVPAQRAIAGDLIKIPSFRQKVKERYLECYAPILESLISTGELMPSFEQTLALIRQDLSMDYVLWTDKWKTADGLARYSSTTTAEEIMEVRVSWLAGHKAYLDDYFGSMDISDSELHIYGDYVSVDGKTHQRTCIYHPDEVISEACSHEYVSNDDGSHTGTCKVCGYSITEACEYSYESSGDETHTGTCRLCGHTISEDHAYENQTVVRKATLSKTGILRETCVCGESRDQVIPKLEASDVTINDETVTAGAVQALTDEIKASGGSTFTVILGKDVKKIQAGAFSSTSVKNIIVQTKQLTKKSVKLSLKKSSVAAVTVSVGSKKANDIYVKKYKKIFTASNAGKKVKVRR